MSEQHPAVNPIATPAAYSIRRPFELPPSVGPAGGMAGEGVALAKGADGSAIAVIASNLAEPEQSAVALVEGFRPSPLRAFDQIPMRTGDLLRQALLVASDLADRAVAFVGDFDGAASLFGLLGLAGHPCPARMMVLDFDERVLAAAEAIARRHGFAHLLEVRRYNVFDSVPADLAGRFDCFYTKLAI